MELKTEEQIRTYYEGKMDGVYLFAWWKDGEQLVGSCGHKLSVVLRELALQKEQAVNALFVGRAVYTK
jgi:hypothetical protein